MSRIARKRGPQALQKSAAIFAALGDRTRLRLLSALSDGAPRSIARLTEGADVSRQAISKHLRVLKQAGLVRDVRRGRENHFQFTPEPLEEAQRLLMLMSRQWDEALARLKAFVEQ